MSIQITDVSCAGTVPIEVPVVLTPYIVPGDGDAFDVEEDLSEPAGAQFLADSSATPLEMKDPPDGTPNSTTWLTSPTLAHVVTPAS